MNSGCFVSEARAGRVKIKCGQNLTAAPPPAKSMASATVIRAAIARATIKESASALGYVITAKLMHYLETAHSATIVSIRMRFRAKGSILTPTFAI